MIARDDARVFVTEPLEDPLTLTGRPFAELSVSTTGLDTDFALRLTDVDEDGSHLLIADGIRRLKLREGFEAALPVEAGEIYDVTIQLGHLAYTVAAGHRVGLILTSSNYPFYDANPNTGADFFTTAEASEAVTNTGRRHTQDDALRACRCLADRIDDWFGDADLVLTPTTAVPAPRVGAFDGLEPEALWDAITPIGVFTAGLNVNGSPAASIPSGRSAEELPLGAQLVGRRGEDQRVLALARQLEDHLGGFDPLA